jgi:hypothetical protein
VSVCCRLLLLLLLLLRLLRLLRLLLLLLLLLPGTHLDILCGADLGLVEVHLLQQLVQLVGKLGAWRRREHGAGGGGG